MLRVRLFFGISLFLLLGSCLALVLTLRDLGRTSGLVAHCYQEIATSRSMLSMLKDSESGQRGYMLTGRPRYLAPFLTSLPRVRSDLAQLRSLAADKDEAKDLPEIEALVSARLAEFRATAEEARSGQHAPAMKTVMTNAGEETMDRLRVAVDRFDRNEQAVLVKRTRALQTDEQRALIIVFATAFSVACTALVAALRVYRRGQRTEQFLAGALEDVAEGRSALTKSERLLTAALSHERVIVRELHHRVKNNLQMITSFLQIRARAQGGEIGGELEGLASRMRALALVQAHIYRTDSFDRVDFAGTLSDIAKQIVSSRSGDNVTLIRDLDGTLDLNVSRAVPLGLICCEMIMNAMKHAWPEEQRGTLQVSLKTKSVPMEIEIKDDGTGFVQNDVGQGLGTMLLRSLTGEAGAKVSIDSRPGAGTTATVRLSRGAQISDRAA